MLSHKDTFLQLILLGIGHANTAQIPGNVDWSELEALAVQQGLSAVLVDGVEKIPQCERPPRIILLQWIGEALQGYEYPYDSYLHAVAKLAGWYNARGFKMMVLKGYGCSLNWPKPEHRPIGDIDIWLFGRQAEADAVLEKEKNIKVDKSHHHHTVFEWKDFVVENHYDFVNVHARQSSRELEKVFKELGQDDSHFVELYGEKVYLPSPNLHALFLIRHLVSHFVGANITLRQVLDWAFFVEKHTKEIDWEWLHGLLDTYHMRDFYNCINAICVEDLGFSPSIFPIVQFLPNLKERVLNEILDPAFSAEAPRGLIKRLIYKFRRWRGNSWKHDLCYNETRWSAFWTGIWAKLLKPASI